MCFVKYILPVFFISLIAPGCKKTDSPNTPVDPPVDFTTVPPAATLNTTIAVYIPSSYYSNVDVNISHYWLTSYDPEKGGFSQQGKFDKYNTLIQCGATTGTTNGQRYVPLINSARNYVDIEGLPSIASSSIPTGNGSGYFNLPNGGKIIYPNNAFGIPYGNQPAQITGGMASATSSHFMISHPSVTVDQNGQRWFLRSFVDLSMYYYPQLATGKLTDMEYPIPAGLQASAPDSLDAWHLETGKWVKKGIAKKVGTLYKFTFTSDGQWSFGLLEKGTYKTIQVRTADRIPVINAIVLIKDESLYVAEARTDVNGNAICFIPLNRKFTITIPPSWENPNLPLPQEAAAGPFMNVDSTPYVMNYPASTNRLRVLKGKVTNCDGTPVENGTITVVHPFSGTTFGHIPVVKGQYSIAMVVDSRDPATYTLKLLDNNTGQVGNDTTITWQAGEIKNLDSHLCKAPTGLFMDYTLDGVSYPIKGDTLTFDGVAKKITASQGKHTIEFNYPAGFTWPGSNFISFTSLVFNRETPGNKGMGTLTITRYDAAPGGVVEGYFVFTYTDSGLTEHEVRGIFRLKRST
jgi:hypothetical protein